MAFIESPETGLEEIKKKLNEFGVNSETSSPGSPLKLAATNNHFDEDGLYSLFLLLNPNQASNTPRLWKLLANCGDFTRVPLDKDGKMDPESELAAKVTILLGLITGRYRQPLAVSRGSAGTAPYPPKSVWGEGSKPRPEVVADLYRDLLARLPDLIAGIQRGQYADVWNSDWTAITSTLDLLNKQASLDGHPRPDSISFAATPSLSYTSILFPPSISLQAVPDATSLPHPSTFPHNVALHSFLPPTHDHNRILVSCSTIPVFYLRYESRVRIVSRKIPDRPSDGFGPIVTRLAELEHAKGGKGVWTGEVMERVTPRLFCASSDGEPGPSMLDFREIDAEIRCWLSGLEKEASL